MATILTIPLELLVAISSHLPTSGLAALRLTCKQIEKSLYEWFTQEFFTKKQFMLTHESLQTLIDISKHVSLSKKLTHLIIATNVYDEIPLRFRDGEAAMRYIQGHEAQKALLNTGFDREMLTEAFQGLSNLTTVGIRDFNASNRFRDNGSWSSWGATTVYRETGLELRFSDRGSFTPDVGSRLLGGVFSTVLHALGKANRTPSEIEILLRQQGLPDSAFNLPDFLHPTIEPVLRNLTTLLLNLDMANRFPHTHSNGTRTDTCAGRALRRFLNFTPNLTHLRLNFQKHFVPNNEDFLMWLGDTGTSPSQSPCFFEPAPIPLSSLKQLDFGQLNVRPEVLFGAIAKFASTLEGLSFWKIGLATGNLSFGQRSNLWAGLFSRLNKIAELKLTHVKVGMLQQDIMYVNFKKDDEDPRPLKVKEYKGKEMEKFMVELVEQVSVDWPEPVIPEENESDMDESMADEDEEDEENEDDEEGSEE